MTFSAKSHDTSRGGTRTGRAALASLRLTQAPLWARCSLTAQVTARGSPHENEHTDFMCVQCRSNAIGIKLTDQAAGTARLSQLRPSSTFSSWHKAALSSSVMSYGPSVDIALKLGLCCHFTESAKKTGPSSPPPSQFSDETCFFCFAVFHQSTCFKSTFPA